MQKFLLSIIEFYQKNISPAKPPSCRFYPTCSKYGKEAIVKFGAFKGLVATIYRVLRCNPFNKGGVDMVPAKFFDIFRKKQEDNR